MLKHIRRAVQGLLAWHPASLTVATITNLDAQVVGTLKVTFRTLTFDSSYPTGGEPLTAADLGLSTVVFATAQNKSGYSFEYDIANAKLLAYWVDTSTDGAAMAQVADTTDLNALSGVVIQAWGY